jgi:hypothetical protein
MKRVLFLFFFFLLIIKTYSRNFFLVPHPLFKTFRHLKPMTFYKIAKDSFGLQLMRIHKTFIVNVSHIKSIDRGEDCLAVLTDNTRLEVSRRKKQPLMDRYDKLNK